MLTIRTRYEQTASRFVAMTGFVFPCGGQHGALKQATIAPRAERNLDWLRPGS